MDQNRQDVRKVPEHDICGTVIRSPRRRVPSPVRSMRALSHRCLWLSSRRLQRMITASQGREAIEYNDVTDPYDPLVDAFAFCP